MCKVPEHYIYEYAKKLMDSPIDDMVRSVRDFTYYGFQYCTGLPIKNIRELLIHDVSLIDGLFYLSIGGEFSCVLKYSEEYYRIFRSWYLTLRDNKVSGDVYFFPDFVYDDESKKYYPTNRTLELRGVVTLRTYQKLEYRLTPTQIRIAGLKRALRATTNFDEFLVILYNAKINYFPLLKESYHCDFETRKKILLGINFENEVNDDSN